MLQYSDSDFFEFQKIRFDEEDRASYRKKYKNEPHLHDHKVLQMWTKCNRAKPS